MIAPRKDWVNEKALDYHVSDGSFVEIFTDENGKQVDPLRVYDMSEVLANKMLDANNTVYIMEDLQKGFCLTPVLCTDKFNHGQCVWHGNCLEIPIPRFLPHYLHLAQLGQDLYIRNINK